MQRRQFLINALSAGGVLMLLLLPNARALVQTVGFSPNDPAYVNDQSVRDWANLLRLPEAWAEQKRIEAATGPVQEQVGVLLLDTGVKSHPDLDGNIIARIDFTGQGYLLDLHGTNSASVIAASVNNGHGVVSVAGLDSHVKIISGNVFEIIQGVPKPIASAMRAGFQYALDHRIDQNIRVVNCSFGVTADDDPDATQQLLTQMAAVGIYVIASAGDIISGGMNLDTVQGLWPACYAVNNVNVFAVAALDATGKLLPNSNWGPHTVVLAAPGSNVPTVSFLGNQEGSASFSGTSPASAAVAGALALMCALKETDSGRAADRLRNGAAMTSSLEGKVGYGSLDVIGALNFTFPAGFTLLAQAGTNRAVALESVTLQRDPFSLHPTPSFAADNLTRVALFATNVPIQSGDTAANLTMVGQVGSTSFPLAVEYFSTLRGVDGYYHIVVKLPSNLPTSSDVSVTATLHGVTSNAVIFSVR